MRWDVDGFAVLRSRGVTRRANSAVALDAPEDPQELAASVARIEQMMRTGGLTPRFRVLPQNGPAALDGILEDSGYTLGPVCDLLLRSTAGTAADPSVRIDAGPLPEDWFAAYWSLAAREGDQAEQTIREILAGTPALHASVRGEDGHVLAVGRAALVPQGRSTVVVINGMAVDRAHRRRGHGRRALDALLAAAATHDAATALLEVETDNPAALRLYAAAGFTRIGTYHYRIGPD